MTRYLTSETEHVRFTILLSKTSFCCPFIVRDTRYRFFYLALSTSNCKLAMVLPILNVENSRICGKNTHNKATNEANSKIGKDKVFLTLPRIKQTNRKRKTSINIFLSQH